jgi:hypothetical protein
MENFIRSYMKGGKMIEIKLNRTGRRPFGFIGEEIFNGSNKDHASMRWEVVRLFRTKDGFVAGIALITCMEGEEDCYQVRKFKTEKELLVFVKKRLLYLEAFIVTALSCAKSERKIEDDETKESSGTPDIPGVPGAENLPSLPY